MELQWPQFLIICTFQLHTSTLILLPGNVFKYCIRSLFADTIPYGVVLLFYLIYCTCTTQLGVHDSVWFLGYDLYSPGPYFKTIVLLFSVSRNEIKRISFLYCTYITPFISTLECYIMLI